MTRSGELRAQRCREVVVEFDGQHLCGLGGQHTCDSAAARTDFYDRFVGAVAQRGHNALDGLRIVKEVLAELRLGGHG